MRVIVTLFEGTTGNCIFVDATILINRDDVYV